MRKRNYEVFASQPTSQHSNRHTHEVHFQAANGTVIVRCYSQAAACREQEWQARHGRPATIRLVMSAAN